MPGHFTIELRNLRFFAEHGMYPEEKKVGNDFEVDLSIGSRSPKKIIQSINQTVNYVEVYRITAEVFARHHLLLETCAMEIADRIQEAFPEIENITVTIRKMHPPITNFSGSVGVTYQKEFK